MNYNNRSEVPDKYKWDLSKWFISDAAWEESYNKAYAKVDLLSSYKGNLFKSNNLYLALNDYYNYENELMKLYAYAMLKQDEDLSVSCYSKMFNKINNLFNKYSENSSFFIPEIIQNDKFNVESLLENNPDLLKYKHLLDELYIEKKYIKDEKIEKIITSLTSDIHNHDSISNALLNSDIRYGKVTDEFGQKIELTSGNSSKFSNSLNRNLRKKAYYSMNKQREQFSNTIGKNLIAYMTRKVQLSRVRGYDNVIDMFFEPDKIPLEVYEKLVKNARKSVYLQIKYFNFLKESLKLKQLEIFDLNAPIINVDKKYSIEDAEKYCVEAVSVLGSEYQDIMKKGFSENWVDFIPYKGKASGGYCMSVHGQSSNIMMNYNGDFGGISTLAHEMGHAINFYYSNKNDLADSDHSNYIAEIPSLLNEILLANYVIDGNFSSEEKILVISDLIKTFNSNFFGAVMESEFENTVYKKIDNDESLTSEDLNEISINLQQDYYKNGVKLNKYSPYIWTRRSHYFMPWYIYKYASCLVGAVYFASKILKGEKEILDSYLDFIKAPNNMFPDQILKKYNINLSDDSIYEEFYEYYEMLLNKLEENMKR